jgi:hypothetical protein
MSEYAIMDVDFTEWTSGQVAEYLKTKTEIETDLIELLQTEKVDGKVIHRLTDQDLQTMGIETVGDRHRIMAAIETLSKAKQAKDREKVLWEGQEVLYSSCLDEMCGSCCGCCPDDPETYRLLYNHLEIKAQNKKRCGPCKCCYGHSYEIDNVDLSHVKDVDLQGIPPSCCAQFFCGAKVREHVQIKVDDHPEVTLKLYKGDGEAVSRKIRNQVEVMQMMERN